MSVPSILLASLNALDVLSPPDKYITSVLRTICENLGYKFGSVIEVDEDGKGRMVSSYNLPDDYPEQVAKVSSTLLSSPSGIAIETGEIVVVSDVDKEPKLKPWRELLQRYDLKTIVWVPLKNKEVSFGTFILYDTQVRVPTAEELNAFEQIAIIISVAIISNTYLNKLNQKTSELHNEIKVRIEFENKLLREHEKQSRYIQEIRELNKNLEAFDYSVSNALRVPLRHIEGFAEMLKEYHSDEIDDQLKWYLGQIGSSARELKQLLDDLLKLSMATRRELLIEQINLSVLANSVAIQVMRDRKVSKADITVMKGMICEGDHRLLYIVLYNLLDNALKFIAEGIDPVIEFGEIKQTGEKVFFMRDKGLGFSPERAEELFIPFHSYHTDSEFGGAGLGLATVERIIKRHGGRVWAEGDIGKGATFYFTLG